MIFIIELRFWLDNIRKNFIVEFLQYWEFMNWIIFSIIFSEIKFYYWVSFFIFSKQVENMQTISNPQQKIKPIPRKCISIEANQKGHMTTLIKKAVKIKNLSFDKNFQPKQFSLVKRLTQSCCKYLHSLYLRLTDPEDFRYLIKIQSSMKYIRKIQIDDLYLET